MGDDFLIRPAVEPDTTAMVKVNVDTLRATYPDFYPAELLAARNYETVEASWRHVLWASTETENYAFVAETATRQIVGVLICGPAAPAEEEFQGEIFSLFVLPAYHCQGLGKKLVRAAAMKLFSLDIPTMIVWVLAANPARQFYQAVGGQPVREKEVQRGPFRMKEIGYGWPDIKATFQLV